jgi:hypothetical protein
MFRLHEVASAWHVIGESKPLNDFLPLVGDPVDMYCSLSSNAAELYFGHGGQKYEGRKKLLQHANSKLNEKEAGGTHTINIDALTHRCFPSASLGGRLNGLRNVKSVGAARTF